MPVSPLTARDYKAYDVGRLILAADCSGRRMSCLESEVSDQIERDTGQTPQMVGGKLLHPDIYLGHGNASRALSISTFAAGGALVGEQVAPVVPYLLGQSYAGRLGARFVGGIDTINPAAARGSLRFPVGTGTDEAQWVPDNTAPSNQNATIGTVTASAHRLVATLRCSKQLLIQNGQGGNLPMIFLLSGIAAAFDRAALAGTGGAQPLGLLALPGVTAVSIGDNGGAPTLASLNSAEGAVIRSRVPLTTPGWILSANAREKAKNTPKAAGASAYLLETVDGQDHCNGFPSYASTLMPDNGSKGSGSNLGSAIFGVWEWEFFVQWGSLEVVSDPYTYAAAGDVQVTVSALADVVTPRQQAFAIINDIVTT